jgi:hypothetical protein
MIEADIARISPRLGEFKSQLAPAGPEFGFISLKGWLGTILMNGC